MRVVGVFVLVFLCMEGSLAQVASTDAAPKFKKCAVQSLIMLGEFASAPQPSNSRNTTLVEGEIRRSCARAPSWLRLSDTAVDALRQVPVLRFIFDRFQQKPEYRLSFARQQEGLLDLANTATDPLTLHTTALLQISSPPPPPGSNPAFPSHFKPFWVYHVEDMESNECYAFHLFLYVVSWIALGGFLFHIHMLFEGLLTNHMEPHEMGQLKAYGLGAVLSHVLFTVVEVLCGPDNLYNCDDGGRMYWNFLVLQLLVFVYALCNTVDTTASNVQAVDVQAWRDREANVERMHKMGKFYPGDQYAEDAKDAEALQAKAKKSPPSMLKALSANSPLEELDEAHAKEVELNNQVAAELENEKAYYDRHPKQKKWARVTAALRVGFRRSRFAKIALVGIAVNLVLWVMACRA